MREDALRALAAGAAPWINDSASEAVCERKYLLPVQLQRLDSIQVRTLDAESSLPGPMHVCIACYFAFGLGHGLTILELGSNRVLICADCILKLQPNQHVNGPNA